MAGSDVLVVGAGPTGLTLACDLARRGVAVRIIDKAPAPFAGSRGKGLQPRSQEVFDDLGVIEAIRAGAFEHLPVRMHRGGVVVSDADPYADRHPTPAVPYPCRLILPQWRVEAVLRERLAAAGVSVEQGTTLDGLGQDGDEVHAELAAADGTRSTATARFLVGADGGHSRVRAALGLAMVGETRPVEALILGDVEVSGLPADRWYLWADPDRGVVALCPFVGVDSWQIQVGLPPDEHGRLPTPTLDAFRAAFAAVGGDPGVSLDRATWLSTYRVNVRMVQRYRVGRVFLAGDAAHVHSPAGGLGMNTGVQDAYNLGWKLGMVLAGRAGAALLDTYEEERLPVAAWTLGLSSRQLERLERRLPAAGGWPTDDQAAQLGLNYRWSRLAVGPVGDGLQAGDRAPDAPCVAADERRVRLFDLFRGPHATLLGLGAGTGPALRRAAGRHPGFVVPVLVTPDATTGPPQVVRVVDRDGHVGAAYGSLGEALVLVRPDGYLGLVVDGTDDGSVGDYLHRLSGPAASP